MIVQNSQKVQVDFLFVHTTTPLIFALLIAGVLGALIGWLTPHVRRTLDADGDAVVAFIQIRGDHAGQA